MAFDPPTLPPFQPEWASFQIWWQQVVERLKAVLDPLIDLNNDDLLTPAKKPLWVFQHSYLTGEQAGLDAQATTLGITTEKTNYDSKITAMVAYLATLTTPVMWNDFTGNTAVVGATLRTKFNDVLVAKQALINAMTNASSGDAAAALAAANAAQSTANTAQSTANTASSTATAVQRQDSIADSWTSPGAILSAADAGGTATINIASHTRKYNDNTSVSVNGGSLTGRANSTTYYVYYDQTSRNGGTVSYQSTTDPNIALPGAAAGRHWCGPITTPAGGGGSTSGGVSPPGTGGGGGGFTSIP